MGELRIRGDMARSALPLMGLLSPISTATQNNPEECCSGVENDYPISRFGLVFPKDSNPSGSRPTQARSSMVKRRWKNPGRTGQAFGDVAFEELTLRVSIDVLGLWGAVRKAENWCQKT